VLAKESNMTAKNLKHTIWLILAASLAVSGGVFAKGPGSGGSGGGNKPPTEVGNSLSVPAIMAGGRGTFALVCNTEAWTNLAEPSKAPVYYPAACAETHDGEVCVDEGYYFVQRDAAWQAPCFVSESAPVDVLGRWGDNLAGDAMLKVGSPIRVELVLLDGADVAEGRQGYFVIKLEPAELDRLSHYGHLANEDLSDHPYVVGDPVPGGTFAAIVYDPTAHLTIQRMEGENPVGPAAYDGAAGGEINATGKIVYGYNLRVSVPGTYRITYSFTNVNFASNDEDVAVCDAGVCEGATAYLDIEVVGGGGGGGGKGGGQGGGKPVKPGK
jgi:hypothetical protein